MIDHPLYLKHVMLKDGRKGTIVDVFDQGEAFMIELSRSTGLDGLIIICLDDLKPLGDAS